MRDRRHVGCGWPAGCRRYMGHERSVGRERQMRLVQFDAALVIIAKGGGVMSRKAKRVPKRGAVWHLSPEEATLAKKPHYNGFACGHGAHGDAKYNRARVNRSWKRDMQKGPHGPFFGMDVIARAFLRARARWLPCR